ncbi:MAG: Glu-tRNA(Gln) amidotransferase subunit GatE [Deltaproteobacteria bacterium]|nr:Glu-tRNA(Gln) amidotransferase subunit GatE [Deltaproteobacteria bacterium]
MSTQPQNNYDQTKKIVGYKRLSAMTPADYAKLGFKCGLEIHQQLKTRHKLFCRCPAGIYHNRDDFNSEVLRNMRPTLSELGEYDGTALMEFKTRKNITYRINYQTACTYDIDDTPPFLLNREALDIALEMALLLKLNIVGETHITRKQYLDGSIPTGFQRTAILGVEGRVTIPNKKIGIIQLSIEEDSCREVSDIGHERIYTTDRLGMPLMETVTRPDMTTPQEAAEVGHYLRFMARSTSKVNVGSGAARQDVNVSITGGTRVEIKGVQRISHIPKLTHHEAFRQKALIEIAKILQQRLASHDWQATALVLNEHDSRLDLPLFKQARAAGKRVAVINLPLFGGLLSFFTQPGQSFASELSDRLKVIACLEKPNLIHSEQSDSPLCPEEFTQTVDVVQPGAHDAQVVIIALQDDLKTALETIEERCKLAFTGVPNETRKALSNGTTLFERVLPGPDRMYPDTDSAPIAITEKQIETIRASLPPSVASQFKQLAKWQAPPDTHHYILRNNLMPLIKKLVTAHNYPAPFVCTVFAHNLKHLQGAIKPSADFSFKKIYGLFRYVAEKKLKTHIIKEMLPAVYEHPNISFESLLESLHLKNISKKEIADEIPPLKRKFTQICTSRHPGAQTNWIMGELKKLALGSLELKNLRKMIEGAKS